jgi:hypothetical protein
VTKGAILRATSGLSSFLVDSLRRAYCKLQGQPNETWFTVLRRPQSILHTLK